MIVSDEPASRPVGTIWMLNLEEPISMITPGLGATFARYGPEAASVLAEAMGDDVLVDVRHRFSSGRRCYTARVNDQIAAYGWVSFDEEFVGELNLHLKLLPDEAYIWNCATLSGFRRKYLYSALLTYIVRELQKDHVSRVWIGADKVNVPSQKGIARAGFTYVADLVITRVKSLRQIGIEGQPGVPAKLVAQARRVFLNDREKISLPVSNPSLST